MPERKPPRDREQQFLDWFENATGEQLLAAATDSTKERLNEDFLESSAYTRALEAYSVENISGCQELEDFDESAWLDEDEAAEAEDLAKKAKSDD